MADVTLNPYIFFKGNCQEAMEFYKDIFGGELFMQKYDEVPGYNDETMKGKLMHAELKSGSIYIMASDMPGEGEEGNKISLSLVSEDEAVLRGYFEKLSAGGSVGSALKKESWGDIYGNLTDKFGISWMVNISIKKDTP